MHLIHDIEPLIEPVAEHMTDEKFVRAVVEISHGSKQKYEVDHEYGIIKLDRTLLTPNRYPMNYGFIPRTLGVDGDPLDILVFAEEPILPGVLVVAKPIGIFDLITDGESDHKVISVIHRDPFFSEFKSFEEFPESLKRELKQFLLTYKALENKDVKIGPFTDSESAWKMIHQSIQQYRDRV